MILERYLRLPKNALPVIHTFLLENSRDDIFQIPTTLRQAS